MSHRPIKVKQVLKVARLRKKQAVSMPSTYVQDRKAMRGLAYLIKHNLLKLSDFPAV